jgi:methyl-accepting chemotaxis protein
MSELKIIETALEGAARRRRWDRAFHGLARASLVGAGLLLVAVAAYKLFPLPQWVMTAGGVAAGVCALAGLVIGGWRKPARLEVARWVDERKQLKERLSTALELSDGAATADWKQLLVHDAACHAESLKPAEILPFRFPKIARWALAVLVLAAGIGFVPEYRTKAHEQQQKDKVNVKEVGKELADLTRKELVRRPPALPATQSAMDQVAELGDKLNKQTLTKGEAIKDIASMTDKLVKQDKELNQTPPPKQLEKAAREPANGASASPDAMQKQLDAMQKALGEAAAKSDKLDKLAKDMQKLQQQAANMSSDSKASASAREQLAQSLADLAKQAQEAGASLEELDAAIEALKSNNTDQFIKDLEAASHDLDKMRQMAKSMQALKQQMAKMGKDLAEQLDKGQAQAAVQTLQKMIDQLKEGNLSKEELEKIMQEVSKAVDPAKDYGKVAEHLQKAAQQCKGGDKPGAGQSLAEAQKELEKLLEQMADSEALDGMLDALARADQAIRSGKRWSECKGGKCGNCNGEGCSACKGRGWKHGGGNNPSGVGTWADDYGWTYFSENDGNPVDNSGIVRPEMDSRGHTDRPDDLNPNLSPDKVKGQMSPGGSMPSITLKGVSIKGTSTVKFEEAATTAQAEAQNALNQDKVPRAYQNAVRDYFDDLKK